MEEVQVQLDENDVGHFYILVAGERLGEMDVRIAGSALTVYHTEVAEKAEGKGYAKLLLKKMVCYAREKGLQVIPLCPFVHAQFKRHPDEYADIWKQA